MNPCRIVALLCLSLLATCRSDLRAATIFVPNASFEMPSFPAPVPNFESWQKTPKPEWYDESGGFLWTQLTGTFPNQPPDETNHIANCDGVRAAWLFAEPEAGFFQDYESLDLNDPAPTHEFNAVYEPGKSYQLTVGLFGGGAGGNFGMLLGVTLELALYYRDANSNQIVVASTTITNTAEDFTSNTNLVDYTVKLPVVRLSDAWANQNIGIRCLSTVSPEMHGGYWDLDNVRLSSTLAPLLVDPVVTNGHFQSMLRSEPGMRCAILTATNSPTEWTGLGIITNTSGEATFVDTNPLLPQRFYRVEQVQ